MERIFIEKDQSVPSIVERMLSCPGDELVLVVPKNAELKSSISNFHILKREAAAAEKSILIESVDAEILALAEKAHVEAFHPLFRKETSRSLSDIVPQEAHGIPPAVREGSTPVSVKVKRGRKTDDEPKELPFHVVPPVVIGGDERAEEMGDESGETSEEETEREELEVEAISASVYRVSSEDAAPRASRFSRLIPRLPRLSGKTIVVLGGMLLALGFAVWVAGAFFGRARVAIEFRVAPLDATNAFTATKTATMPDVAARILPAEVLNQKKTATQFFPASGRADVSQKATARLTIWNAYSSERQSLVATTRFVTPDGKVFRLDSGVTVPGAEVRDGKIIPSSIETSVTADKPGAEYNIGPVEKLTIPGFQGGPKYTGFYGSLPGAATGGFIGNRAVPTADDEKNARAKVTKILEDALGSNVLSNRPDDLIIPNGASEVAVTRVVVNKATDNDGNFSVLGEAELRAIAFRGADLRASLLTAAGRDPEVTTFRDLDLGYSDVKADLAKGELSFTLHATGDIVPVFDSSAFKTRLAGLPVAEARTLILGLPELVRAELSLWPIWMAEVPKEASRIEITTN